MERGPKVYATPDDLSELNGPGFKFVLNHNDHRWTVTFKRQSPSVHWIDKYKQVSMSRSFQFDVEDDLHLNMNSHPILKVVFKYKNHPSIISIRSFRHDVSNFNFPCTDRNKRN